MLYVQGYFVFSLLTSCLQSSWLFKSSGWSTGCTVAQLSDLSQVKSNNLSVGLTLVKPFIFKKIRFCFIYQPLSHWGDKGTPTTAAIEQGRDREGVRGRELAFGWQRDIFVSWSSLSTQMHSHALYIYTDAATEKAWLLSPNASHADISTKYPGCTEGIWGRKPSHVEALDKRDLLDDYLARGTY